MKDSIFKEQSPEEFVKEREELIAQCFKEAENSDTMIPYEDLDYYLDELEKLW